MLLSSIMMITASCARSAPAGAGANLVLITLDTTRADHISPLGAEPRMTPNLQALADRSSLFTNAFSETNVTNPSHLTIMTGLPAVRHGVVSNVAKIPESVDTLAEAMKRAGYQTAGFPAIRHLSTKFGWQGFDLLLAVEGKLKAGEVTDRALTWMASPAAEPFFLWVHYFDPHTIYDPPAEIARQYYSGQREAGEGPRIADKWYFQARGAKSLRRWLGDTRDPAFGPAMYAAEIHYMDREIGRLLAGIAELGAEDRTVVIVVADHGESLGEHEIYYDHAGLYEQILRIPLIMHVPGMAPSQIDATVSTLDLVPTISELMGIRMQHATSGMSLLRLLKGGEDRAFSSRPLIHQNAHNHAVAVRHDGWKLIWPINRQHAVLPSQPQLFDLSSDRGELNDLAASDTDRVARLRLLLEPWIQLGVVKRGRPAHLDDAALEQLQALGYVDD
jgi:arylsulfatase A-like enzyme